MIYNTTFKGRPAVALQCDGFTAFFLPEDGAKLASLRTNAGCELLEQAKGDEYLRLHIDSEYIDCECSAFDDLFPTVDPCTLNGKSYLDHGEVCRRPHEVRLEEDSVTFTCRAECVGATFQKIVSVQDGALSLAYKITNNGAEALPCLWAGHMMFAGRAGARVTDNFPADTETITMFGTPPADRFIGELAPFSPAGETYKYYYTEAHTPLCCGVYYPDTGEQVTVSFSGDAVKYLGVWMNNGAFKGMHNIALEPCTAPFDSPVRAEQAEKGAVIPPNGEISFTMKIAYVPKKKMKAFFADGNGQGGLRSVPMPEIAEDEVLMKVHYCGVCGTDRDLFSGDCSFSRNGQVTYPARLGHEWSGVVVKTGAKVTDFLPGDRVVGDNVVACGKCEQCRNGAYNKCTHYYCVGTINPIYDGAFSEYFKLPARHVYKIPEGYSLRESALFEPLSVAYGGIKHMNIQKDSVVAVIGTGCIALSAVALAKALGCEHITVVGRNPKKLAAAAQMGAKTVNFREEDPVATLQAENGEGADFVLECSGAAGAFKQAIDLAAPYATVALIGFYDRPEDGVNAHGIVSKSLTIIGTMGEIGNTAGAIEILKKARVDLSPIITDEVAFADCLPAFTASNYPDTIKTIVKINTAE